MPPTRMAASGYWARISASAVLMAVVPISTVMIHAMSISNPVSNRDINANASKLRLIMQKFRHPLHLFHLDAFHGKHTAIGLEADFPVFRRINGIRIHHLHEQLAVHRKKTMPFRAA